MTTNTIDGLRSRIGEELGQSSWMLIDQERIDQFGSATSDPDPMHVDPDWAKENSPFGTTISFGFLTMSVLTALYHDVMSYDRQGNGEGHGLNYGFERLRLVAPVPVGSRIRGRFALKSIEDRYNGHALLRIDCSVEIEGQDKPALVGEWLVMWVAD